MKTIDYKFGLRAVMGAVVIAFVVMFGACSEDAPQPAPEEPEAPAGGETPVQKSVDIELTAEGTQIADATITTAFKLFKAMSDMERNKAHPQDNVVFSPLSISWLMSMLANGAAGETQAQILSGLGYEDHSMESVNEFFKKIAPALSSIDPNCEFNSARSVWMVDFLQSYTRESFVRTVSEYYCAPVTFVEPFYEPEVCDGINDWFARQTNGLINNLFTPTGIVDGMIYMLADALYFKGKWTFPFNPERTVDYTFLNEDGSESRVKMMEGPDMQYYVQESDSFFTIRLPFGNEAYRMSIVIPKENVDLDECVAAVCENPARMKSITSGIISAEDHILHLPKFDLEYDSPFHEVVKNELRITQIFSDKTSDFSGLFLPEYLNLPNVTKSVGAYFQKCRISIDEEKAESAAGSYAFPHCGPEQLPYEIFVDRPFIFLISERSTGLPLFMGRVTKL